MNKNVNQQGAIGKLIFLMIVLGLIGSGYYIKQNLDNTIPGDFLYPLKDVNEGLILGSSEAEYDQRARDYIDFSINRMSEIKKLVEQKKDKAKIINTLNRLAVAQDEVAPNIYHAKQLGQYSADINDKFKQALQEQSDTLDKLSVIVEPDVYQPILDAKFKTDNLLESISQ